ncbi:MAG: CDP-diacylglycerol--glycerol-3-phosphate 3-phosphatidyltransferase [Lachnospiraceae bacterium]|nr:CDP-diacylglycerol--glycerol-3-phosphate 3-phosphatidyltransferase [Lachnospiraceae bacterium]
MNLPNKLTLFRVVLIPFFVAILMTDLMGDKSRWIALVIFVVASLTDLLDGKIARKYNLVTTFGKFADPLADKLLVVSAMICLVELGDLAAWIAVIIVAREFIISGFRIIAAEKNVVIAASYWGKFKTTFQMIMIIMLLAGIGHPAWHTASTVVTYIALILTVVSLIDYIVKNKGVMKDENYPDMQSKGRCR